MAGLNQEGRPGPITLARDTLSYRVGFPAASIFMVIGESRRSVW